MRRARTATGRWRAMLALTTGALGAFAVPANADTAVPVWSCRASAGYVESAPILMNNRIEPIQANGFPDSTNPDRAQCATEDQGAPNITLPPGPNQGLQLTLQAPHANTAILPELGNARDQTASAASSTAVNPLQLVLGPNKELVVRADELTAHATASCVNGQPTLSGSSQVVNLTINGNAIQIPPNQANQVIPADPLVHIVANEQVKGATADGEQLTQRALHIQLLTSATGPPGLNVVLAESKVDRHGDTCAPPPPPPPCPLGSTRQNDICVATVTNTTVVTQPGATTPGATVPAGGVQGQTLVANGVNGGGCARMTMHFVRNRGHSLTNRFGNRLVTRGRIVNCRGKSIVGAKIDVVHVIRGQRRLIKTGLRSRPGGRLTLILPLNLTSRRIVYSYRPNLLSRRVTARVTLRLTVRDRRGRILR